MTGQPAVEIDLSILKPAAIVVDIVYVPILTPLLELARRRGLRTVGLERCFIKPRRASNDGSESPRDYQGIARHGRSRHRRGAEGSIVIVAGLTGSIAMGSRP